MNQVLVKRGTVTGGTDFPKDVNVARFAGAVDEGCFLCGGPMPRGKYTCEACIRLYGPEATKTVKEVMAAYEQAKTGYNKDAESATVVFGVIAQIRVNEGARPFMGSLPDDTRLWAQVYGKKGWLHMTYFGFDETDKGNWVVALVQIRQRETPDGLKKYAAAVKLPGVISPLSVQFNGRRESYVQSMPHLDVTADYKGKHLEISVGFVAR